MGCEAQPVQTRNRPPLRAMARGCVMGTDSILLSRLRVFRLPYMLLPRGLVMREIPARFSLCGAFFVGATIFVLAFLAYFVRSGMGGGQIQDGLGRTLEPSPWIISLIMQTDHWAGWPYFPIDFVVFWGGVGAAFILLTAGLRKSNQS